MKKWIAILLCVLTGMLAIFSVACGGSETQNPSDNGEPTGELDPNTEVNITFMHMWPEHETTMNRLVAIFESQNPNIHVDTSITPYDKIETSLQSAFIANQMPNVYTFYTHFMNPLVSSSDGVMAGTLNGLHDKIADNFLQSSSWEMGKFNGNYYSAPFRITAEAIFYNKTIFAQNGWTVPTTFEEFEALLKAVSDSGKYTPLAAGGKEGQITYVVNALNLFCAILDGAVEEEGYQLGRLEPDYEDETGSLVYDKVRNWYAAGYFGKNAMAASKQNAIQQFVTSEGTKAAMLFANVTNIGDISSTMSDEVGLFAIPAPSAIADQVKYVYGGFDGLSYSPNATNDQKLASIKLIEFLTSQQAQQIIVDGMQSITVLKGVEYHSETYRAFSEEVKYVGAYATSPDYMTGGNASMNEGIIQAYIMGSPAAYPTALDMIKQINKNTYADMQDFLLNSPVKDWMPRKNAKKDYDRSWLA